MSNRTTLITRLGDHDAGRHHEWLGADRPSMSQHFRSCHGWGAGPHYQWTDTGELTTPAIFRYEVVAAES